MKGREKSKRKEKQRKKKKQQQQQPTLSFQIVLYIYLTRFIILNAYSNSYCRLVITIVIRLASHSLIQYVPNLLRLVQSFLAAVQCLVTDLKYSIYMS